MADNPKNHKKRSQSLVKNAMMSTHGLNYPSRRFLLPQRKHDPNRILPTKPSVANLQLDPSRNVQALSQLYSPVKKKTTYLKVPAMRLDGSPGPMITTNSMVTSNNNSIIDLKIDKMPLKTIQI